MFLRLIRKLTLYLPKTEKGSDAWNHLKAREKWENDIVRMEHLDDRRMGEPWIGNERSDAGNESDTSSNSSISDVSGCESTISSGAAGCIGKRMKDKAMRARKIMSLNPDEKNFWDNIRVLENITVNNEPAKDKIVLPAGCDIGKYFEDVLKLTPSRGVGPKKLAPPGEISERKRAMEAAKAACDDEDEAWF